MISIGIRISRLRNWYKKIDAKTTTVAMRSILRQLTKRHIRNNPGTNRARHEVIEVIEVRGKLNPMSQHNNHSNTSQSKADANSTPSETSNKTASIDDTIQQLVLTINTALDDMKAVDISELNIREFSSIADMMIVASGNSNRHVKAIADTIVEKAKEAGFRTIGIEGTDTAEWVLLDFGDVIAHIMLPKSRAFYDLEKLWSARPSNATTAGEGTDHE